MLSALRLPGFGCTGSTVSQTAHLAERGAFANVHAGHVSASDIAVVVVVVAMAVDPITFGTPGVALGARLQLANSGPERKAAKRSSMDPAGSLAQVIATPGAAAGASCAGFKKITHAFHGLKDKTECKGITFGQALRSQTLRPARYFRWGSRTRKVAPLTSIGASVRWYTCEMQ